MMISLTGEQDRIMNMSRAQEGFTLIELILVMAVLATVLALSAPTLSQFMTGRSLQEECRRFVALTQYGRSQAVSRSVPMELWISTETGEYGLKPIAGYEMEEEEPIEWHLEDKLSFQIASGNLSRNDQASIIFLPDGSISPESLERLIIRENEHRSMEIAQISYGLGYAIQNGSRNEP